MTSFSLTTLCEGVKCGLRFAELEGSDKIVFTVPEILQKNLPGSPEELANLLNLLLTWILTEISVDSIAVEWDIGTVEEKRMNLKVLIRLETKNPPPAGGGLLRFSSLPSVPAILDSLGGSISSAQPDRLELHVALARGESKPDDPIEITEVLEELGETDFCFDMIGEYMDKTGGLIERLAAGLAAHDPVTVHRIAHTIKGGAYNIRAPKLRGSAGDLENEAKAGRLENGAYYLSKIRDEYRSASKYFKRIKKEYLHDSKKSALR